MPDPPQDSIYVEPGPVADPADCFFYHRMELPELGEVGGTWDLRDCVDEYLGGLDYDGKRALDVGAASGYLTFMMEERGAEVVSFDMDTGMRWDLVPRHDRSAKEYELMESQFREGQIELQNGYWLAHRLMRSRARVYHGDVYALPRELGAFDVVFFGMIITHLRDAFGALHSASRLCRETLVITNPLVPLRAPVARFLPADDNLRVRSWWVPSLECLDRMLGLLGFEIVHTLELEPIRLTEEGATRRRCTSVVARRR